jgi:hypothetical protein
VNVTVPVQFGGGGSTANSADYSFPSGHTITIPAGSTSGTLTVNLVVDGVNEPSETLLATLTRPTNGTLGAVTTDTITILDNDPVTIVFGKATTGVKESNSKAVLVKLSRSTTQTITATVTVNSGPTPGGNFKLVNGATSSSTSATVTLGPRATSVYAVQLIDDAVHEGTETVVFGLSNATGSGASIGKPSSSTVTILDND